VWEICGMNLYPHTETIATALNDGRANAEKTQILFDHYTALSRPQQEAFVLALIGELMVARVMRLIGETPPPGQNPAH